MSFEFLIPIGILALVDTLSPTTLSVTVYMLLMEEERLIRRLFAYLLTVGIFYFTVGIFLMMGVGSIFHKFPSFDENVILSQFMFYLGLGLFIGSFFVPAKSTPKTYKPKSKSMLAMVMLGLMTGLIEVGTALPYFAAIGIMTTVKLNPFQWIPILAGYNFIMVLPPLILIGIHLLFKQWLREPLMKIKLRLEKNQGATLSWIMAIVGLIILINS